MGSSSSSIGWAHGRSTGFSTIFFKSGQFHELVCSIFGALKNGLSLLFMTKGLGWEWLNQDWLHGESRCITSGRMVREQNAVLLKRRVGETMNLGSILRIHPTAANVYHQHEQAEKERKKRCWTTYIKKWQPAEGFSDF
ncbi:hypothetical protein TWF730_006923 [Orbilia blumenaviensis]|uniref:Uncharacterized protein n=1 Tax=Orbilia blumenaviensis TaxID=1796055 RepID=A0AAV9VIM9_9PEZI